MRSRLAGLPVLLAILVILAACSDDGSGASLPDAGSELAERGRTLVQTAACTSCHSADGKSGAGPTWKGLAGSTVELTNGDTVVADEAYLRESITDPNAKVRKGYPPIMPSTKLDPDDLDAIVAYLQELGDD